MSIAGCVSMQSPEYEHSPCPFIQCPLFGQNCRCTSTATLAFQTCTLLQVGYARFSNLHDAQTAIEYLNGFPLDEDFPTPVKAFMSTTQLNVCNLPLSGSGRTALRATGPLPGSCSVDLV